MASIDLVHKQISLSGGVTYSFDKLISTIPLNSFISLINHVPKHVIDSSSLLRCTSLLLINILGKQTVSNPYHWLYVYDEDKYSTRISQTHLLSPENTPDGIAGIQVEVYASPYRPFAEGFDEIVSKVLNEILDMSLLDDIHSVHYKFVPYANIIFDKNRRSALDTIFSYFEGFGLVREDNDLDPVADWSKALSFTCQPELYLAGRYAQWNYFWSDDCILRGSQLSGIHLEQST